MFASPPITAVTTSAQPSPNRKLRFIVGVPSQPADRLPTPTHNTLQSALTQNPRGFLLNCLFLGRIEVTTSRHASPVTYLFRFRGPRYPPRFVSRSSIPQN